MGEILDKIYDIVEPLVNIIDNWEDKGYWVMLMLGLVLLMLFIFLRGFAWIKRVI